MSLIDDVNDVLDIAEQEIVKSDGRSGRRDASRANMIDAGYRLFMANNERPTDKQIVAHAGRSARTFYQVFTTTEAYWTAVFEQHGDAMRDRLGIILADGNSDTLLRLVMLGRP